MHAAVERKLESGTRAEAKRMLRVLHADLRQCFAGLMHENGDAPPLDHPLDHKKCAVSRNKTAEYVRIKWCAAWAV